MNTRNTELSRCLKKAGTTSSSTCFLLLALSFVFKFKWAPCSFEEPAKVRVFMILMGETNNKGLFAFRSVL